MEKQEENKFLVNLDGIHLSEEQKLRINSGIQEIVMRELAQMDNLKDYGISKKKEPIDIHDLHPFIWGIKWDGARNKIILNGYGR